MSINCIVIDDEQPAIDQIVDYIGRVPFLKHLQSFNNAIEPIQFLKNNVVDVVFLDIEMESFSGIQFIKAMERKPKVILTTAYDEYAIEAFNLNVTDYLLKPISFERFLQSVDKIYDQTGHLQEIGDEPAYKRDYFFVKTEFRMQRIDFNEILFIEGKKEYLQIITKHEKVMTLQSFANINNLLPKNNFIRVHKSYMVAINKIESVEKNRIKIAGSSIPISESYKDAFFMVLKHSK